MTSRTPVVDNPHDSTAAGSRAFLGNEFADSMSIVENGVHRTRAHPAGRTGRERRHATGVVYVGGNANGVLQIVAP